MKPPYTAGTPLWNWILLGLLVLILLGVDLLVHSKKERESVRAAFFWSGVWIAAGLLFNVFTWVYMGSRLGQEYLAAYLIEKSLSLDNLFVFMVVFKSLRIPEEHQHMVLFWGILGALVFRAIFIFLGVAAIERFEWLTYVFGAILLYAAYGSLRRHPEKEEENKAVKWLSGHLPVTHEIHGRKFVVKREGRLVATPLLIALAGLELTDVVFAIDSVPAALSVSTHLFVVYSSNIFAILGLRALYIALSHTLTKLRYLHYGLAGVLAFAGIKMILGHWVEIPTLISVAITLLMIGAAVLASVRNKPEEPEP